MTKKKKGGTQKENTLPMENQPELLPDGPAETGANIADDPNLTFPIVGIGASAGGLTAFEAFFKAMPAGIQTGMAFVLVQHLSPDHKSILKDLIQEYTTMQVFEIENGMVVAPDCIYIIPPNQDLALFSGKLHLLEPVVQRGVRLPIDFFFRSLARDQHERAICIVLSGTGSDGTLGVRAVKGEGGMVIAQMPESTQYDSMPRSAIGTNMVDYVLPPEEMPAQLIAYAAHAFGRMPKPVQPVPAEAEDVLQKIFILLRAHSGQDFSQYKANTIARRIERRMAVQQINILGDYVRFLQQTPTEVEALFHDLLIGVTSFFRDPEAFAVIESEVVPLIFAHKPAGATIRIWVPGCSTGEEAYSIAILLQEKMEALKQNFKVQLFATDIDSRAIDHARTGVYPASIAADISPERLSRFFSQSSDGTVYYIQKNIRDMLIFSEQNLIQDPPFSKLDMISCRNVLIYMNATLQKKLIPLFHYALVPGGLLFLGNSESVGEFVSLFTTVDRKWKVYRRKEEVSSMVFSGMGPFLPPMIKGISAPAMSEKTAGSARLSLRDLTERVLLETYAPASVLVNSLGEILYIYGRTGQYLEPTPGEAGMNILSMAREGLRRPLMIALRKATAQEEPVVYAGLQVKNNGSLITVNLTVRPVATNTYREFAKPLFLVMIEEVIVPRPQEPSATAVSPTQETAVPSASAAAHIAELEQALQAKEEYLQSTREEMDTANEELKSTNEELQSVNEELQSANEELETSKEELQSVNEELATVNAELQQKVAELSRANNDMNNLLIGTGVGTIFVDHQLRILRFTPAVTQLINLIQTDIGRPVTHIVSNLMRYDRLAADVQDVLNTLALKEVEVQTTSGLWYLLSIRPYRSLENVIEGAVITFVDISYLKKAELLGRLATVVRDAYDAITVQDLQGHILAWNAAAERMYGWSEAEALMLNVRDRIPIEHHRQELDVFNKLGQAQKVPPYQTQRLTKDGRSLDIWLTATALINEAGKIYAIATTERERDPP